MEKTLFSILIFLTSFGIISAKPDSQISNYEGRILRLESKIMKHDSIDNKVTQLIKAYECQDRSNEKTIESISTQISAASYNLTVFGILFAILAIVLGVFISNIEKKVVKIKEENESLLEKTKMTKNEVVLINESILKNISDIYLKIKREETIYALKRLSSEPEDVRNFANQLLSRDLERDDFGVLRDAYYKLKNTPPIVGIQISMTHKELYQLLFFQHFLGLSALNERISDDLVDQFQLFMDCAFETDMEKSTSDFIKEIVDDKFNNKEKIINGFIKGLSKSKHNNLTKVYEIMFKTLGNRVNQFKFLDIISDEVDNQIGKSNYGKVLISTYGNTELSTSEKIAIDNVKKLISVIESTKKEDGK